ncbi:tetratricopeptide repeat protein [Candidatus Sumerlaeota bacterium]|nr:tetratricopeptide repeat protein [Candidatus Sumerlaeota bacterium]
MAMREKSAYSILNLRKDADDQEIKKAYVELVKKYNPEEHTDRFVLIKNAYDRLRDPNKRAAEDCFTFNYVKLQFSFAQDERTRTSELELNNQLKGARIQLKEQPHNLDLATQACRLYMAHSWLNLKQRKYREAIQDWNNVLELDSTHRRAKNNLNYTYIYLGYYYAEHDLYEEAISCWESALKINPDNMPVLHNIALASEYSNDLDRARRYWTETLKRWEKMLRENPENEYIKNCIIEVRKRHGDKAMESKSLGGGAQAIDEYKEVLKIAPNDDRARRQIALAHIEAKEFEQAIESLIEVIKKNPRDIEMLNLLGHAYLNCGSVNEAFNIWRRSLKLDPKNEGTREYMVKAHLSIGRRFRETGQFTQALVHFKQLERLAPGNEEAHIELGMTYLQKGDKRSAQAQYAHVLKLNPSNKFAIRAMSELRLRG